MTEQRDASESAQGTSSAFTDQSAEIEHPKPPGGQEAAAVPSMGHLTDAGEMVEQNLPAALADTDDSLRPQATSTNWLAAVQRGIDHENYHGPSPFETVRSRAKAQKPRHNNGDRSSQGRDWDDDERMPRDRDRPFTLPESAQRALDEIRPNRYLDHLKIAQAMSRESAADRREAAQRKAQEALGIFYDDPPPGVKW